MTDRIRKNLDDLALKLLQEAAQDSTGLEHRVDVFKAVAAFYLGTARASKGKPPEGGVSFAGILGKINHTGDTPS